MEALQRKAVASYKRGNFREAQGLFAEAISAGSQSGARPEKIVALLDQRAAASLQADDFKSAIIDGKEMVKTLRADPRGYLRLGKCFQMNGDYAPAIKSYQKGLRSVPKSHPMYRELERLAAELKTKKLSGKFSKRIDPLAVLPFEIIHRILEQFSFPALARLEGVSRRWQQFLQTDRRLWEDIIDFDFVRRGYVNKRTLHKYVGWAQGGSESGHIIQTLAVSNLRSLDELKCLNFLAINCSQKINSLSLGLASTALSPQFVRSASTKLREPFQGLRKLKVRSPAEPMVALLLLQSISTIEEIDWYSDGSGFRLEGRESSFIERAFESWSRKIQKTKLKVLYLKMKQQSEPWPSAILRRVLELSPDLTRLELHLWERNWGNYKAELFALQNLESFCFKSNLFFLEHDLELRIPSLKELRLMGLRVGGSFHAQPVRLDNLETLEFSGMVTSDHTDRHLLRNLLQFYGIGSSLKSLNLNHSTIASVLSDSQGYFAHIGYRHPNLESISLQGVYEITNSTVDGIVQSDKDKNLKAVDVSATRVTGAGIVSLVRHGVARIGLTSCDVSADVYQLLRQTGVTVAQL